MTLYIKNMVCIRCKMVVKSELGKLGIHRAVIKLGEVTIKDEISSEQLELLNSALKKSGFELLDEQNGILIGKIKSIIVELVHYSGEQLSVNLPEYLTNKLHRSYTFLSTLFLEVHNITIEDFFNTHKIERAKELLIYQNLDIKNIAIILNYKSAGILSARFKEATGFSPTYFRKIKDQRRIASDNV